MPNWNDAATYAYPKPHDKSGWAWEFLRRNPRYSEDFSKARALLARAEKKIGPVAKASRAELEKVDYLWGSEIPRKPSESFSEWRSRCADHSIDSFPCLVHQATARRWGLSELVDPQFPFGAKVRFQQNLDAVLYWNVEDLSTASVARHHRQYESPQHLEGFEPTTYPFVFTYFDLGRDLKRQSNAKMIALRKLQKQLRQLQKQGNANGIRVVTHKLFSRRWKDYLRVLDARVAGATWAEIAEVMFPHITDENPDYLGRARARETHAQAKRLVDRGYLNLLF